MAILKSVTDVVSLVLSGSEFQIFAAWYHAIFRAISQDNCEIVAREVNVQVSIKFPRRNYQTDGSKTEKFWCFYCSPLNFLYKKVNETDISILQLINLTFKEIRKRNGECTGLKYNESMISCQAGLPLTTVKFDSM